MWVVVEWVDPKYPDDGIESITGPFQTKEEAMEFAKKFVNSEVVPVLSV